MYVNANVRIRPFLEFTQSLPCQAASIKSFGFQLFNSFVDIAVKSKYMRSRPASYTLYPGTILSPKVYGVSPVRVNTSFAGCVKGKVLIISGPDSLELFSEFMYQRPTADTCPTPHTSDPRAGVSEEAELCPVCWRGLSGRPEERQLQRALRIWRLHYLRRVCPKSPLHHSR